MDTQFLQTSGEKMKKLLGKMKKLINSISLFMLHSNENVLPMYNTCP